MWRAITISVGVAFSLVAQAQSTASGQDLEQLQRLQKRAQQKKAAEQVKRAPTLKELTAQGLPIGDTRVDPAVIEGRGGSAQATTQAVTAPPAVASPGMDLEKLQQQQQQRLQQLRNRGRTTQQTAAQATGDDTEGVEDAVNEVAFRAMLRELLPMSPRQISRLREQYDKVKQAVQTAPKGPPKPVATSQFVNLSPGSTPPVIRLAKGFVSSLVMLDSTGAPWPIDAFDLGNPKAFDIQWDKKSNTLMIQAKEAFTYGNLAIRLRDLNTPVVLSLLPGQRSVDYRVDLRIQGYGPHAKPVSMSSGLPHAAKSVLLNVLDGVPPPQSQLLRVTDGLAKAWLQGDTLYVRTRLAILSPGWVATMRSADGMRAYEMQKTPLLLVSVNGRIKKLRIEGL